MPRPALLPRAYLRALLVLLALLVWAAPAQAQVRRCVDAQGNSVFTDRPCSSMAATPKAAPVPHPGAYASGFARRGCARSPQALADGVRGALEAQDVNRLASYYHWTGTGTGAATHLMDRLEGIAARPLVAVELLYPEAPAQAATVPDAPGDPAAPATETAADAPPPEAAPEPLALRVDQMRGRADPASTRTEFSLRQQAGCWWIAL